MKLGVTGASGQLGRLVVDRLLDTCKPSDLVAIVRDPAKVQDLATKGVEVRKADYDDRAAWDGALAGLDGLLLISSNQVGRRFPQHKNVIDGAKAAGVRHLVYTSAPKATTSTLVLAPEHKATEEYLSASGVPYTVLRNNWYTENYGPAVRKARDTGELAAAAGSGRVASAERADYAQAAAAVLTGEGHEGKVYELTGDRAWSYLELATAIAEASGRPVSYRPVEPEGLKAAMLAAGAAQGTADFVAALDTNIGAGCLAEVTGDLKRLLGRPATPLEDTVKKLVV